MSAPALPDTYPHWIYDGSEIPDPLGHGERAVEFLCRLKHPKSGLKDRRFQVDPWVERIVRRIYGPRDDQGRRIVRRVVLLVPRGNRKTSLAAALALLHTIGPERASGGECIFAAADRNQAGIGFREAVGVIREDKRVAKAVKVYDAHNAPKRIAFPRDGVVLETISSDGAAQHGRTPSFVLADEIHIWKGRELWEALTTGLDKTDGGLLVIATTAGRGHENLAWEVIEDARKVARGEVDDPTILPILFEASPEADWRDEALWHAVNPGLAHGYPSLQGFRDHAKRAERSPAELESLKQLKLNVWADNSLSPFITMADYDAGAGPIDMAALEGKPCWIGVDMSTTTDLTAVVCAFRGDDGEFIVIPHFFCPADNLRARADKDGVPFPQWAADGHLTATPGNVVDYQAVADHLIALAQRYDVREVGFDPAYAMPVMRPCADAGLPVATIRQSWITQSPALNTLERAVISGKFRHGGNPILRWCFDNIAIHTDSAGNRTMHKGKSKDRIDGAVATWMAVSRADAGAGVVSVYANADGNEDLFEW